MMTTNETDDKTWTEEEIRNIANVAGLDISMYDMDELILGMSVQVEHGSEAGDANITNDDPVQTLKIAIAHLKELGKYYSDVLIPAQREHGITEAVHMFDGFIPMFEDFTNGYNIADMYAGAGGDFSSSSGRPLRDFDHEMEENQPDENLQDMMTKYSDVVADMKGVFGEITALTKYGDNVSFGFAGPEIKNGPYSGLDSWWMLTYGSGENNISLKHETTDDNYEIADVEDFKKLMSKLAHDLYN